MTQKHPLKLNILVYILWLPIGTFTWDGSQSNILRRSYQKGPPVLFDPLLLISTNRVGFTGQTIKIPCPVHPKSYSHGPVIFQWTKDGEEINSLAWSRFTTSNLKVNTQTFGIETTNFNQNGAKNNPTEFGGSTMSQDYPDMDINFLSFDHSSIEDTGSYSCKALNGFGSVQLTYQLVIVTNHKLDDFRVTIKDETLRPMDKYSNTYPGSKPEFKPHFRKLSPFQSTGNDHISAMASIELLNRNVDAFDSDGCTVFIRHMRTTVTLECPDYSGNPFPKIAWFKNSHVVWMPPNSSNQRQDKDVGGEGQSSTVSLPARFLKIEDLRSEDEGFYTCKIYNHFGTLNKTFFLEVVEHIKGPNLIGEHPTNVTIQEGNEATMRCDVRSELQPYIQWLKRLPPKPSDPTANDILPRSIPDATDGGGSLSGISVLFKKFTDNKSKLEDLKDLSESLPSSPPPSHAKNNTAWSEENGQIVIKVGRQRFLVLPSDRSQKRWNGPNGQYYSQLKIIGSETLNDGGVPRRRHTGDYYVCMVVNAVGYDFRGAYVSVLPNNLDSGHANEANDIIHETDNGGDSQKPSTSTDASKLSLPALVTVPILSLALVLVAIFTTRSFFPRSEKAKLAMAMFGKKHQLDPPITTNGTDRDAHNNQNHTSINGTRLVVNTDGVHVMRAETRSHNLLNNLFGCCRGNASQNQRANKYVQGHFKPHEAASTSFSAYMSVATHPPITNTTMSQTTILKCSEPGKISNLNSTLHHQPMIESVVKGVVSVSNVNQSSYLTTPSHQQLYLEQTYNNGTIMAKNPKTVSSSSHKTHHVSAPFSPLNKLKFYRIESEDEDSTDVGTSVSRQRPPHLKRVLNNSNDGRGYYESYVIAELDEDAGGNNLDGGEECDSYINSSYCPNHNKVIPNDRMGVPRMRDGGQMYQQLPHPGQILEAYYDGYGDDSGSSCCCNYNNYQQQQQRINSSKTAPQSSRLNNSYADEYFSSPPYNPHNSNNKVMAAAAPSLSSDPSDFNSNPEQVTLTPRPILHKGLMDGNINGQNGWGDFSANSTYPPPFEREGDPEGSSAGRTDPSPLPLQAKGCTTPNNSISIINQLNTTYPTTKQDHHHQSNKSSTKHTNAYYIYSL